MEDKVNCGGVLSQFIFRSIFRNINQCKVNQLEFSFMDILDERQLVIIFQIVFLLQQNYKIFGDVKDNFQVLGLSKQIDGNVII